MVSFGAGQQDVGGFDVAMQQVALVRVVEGFGDGGDDFDRLGQGHSGGVPLAHVSSGVGAVDVVHRDPQLPLELTAIVQADDVRVPQRCGDVGLTVEPVAVLGVTGQRGGHDLERILAGKARMLGQVDLAHAAGTE